MFLFSKIIPLFLLPQGIVIILLISNIFNNKKWKSISALFILGFFSIPLTGEILWRFLEYPYYRLEESEAVKDGKYKSNSAIVVLGSGRHPAPGKSQVSEWGGGDRFFSGIKIYKELLKNGQPTPLIFTGGWSPTMPNMPSEGETLKKEAISLGIDKRDIRETKLVTNTAQEGSAVREILPNRNRIILITSAFHMKRAKRIFERNGFTVAPFPVDFKTNGQWGGSSLKNPLNYIPTASGLRKSTSALHEYMGRTLYWAW